MVLSRPPSLEPSTPLVREPTKYGLLEIISGSPGYPAGVAAADGPAGPDSAGARSAHRRHDGGGGAVVAEPHGVQHQVVVIGVEPVVVVDLPDVGASVGVHPLEPVARLLLADPQPLAHRRGAPGL